MNSPSTRALMGAGIAAMALVGALSFGSLPLMTGLLVSVAGAALAFVAFVTQARRLEAQERLVYRPVYVRVTNIQPPVRSDED